MKRINIVYLFLMLAVLGSCLDEDPQYTTNSKVVYSDEQSAQMALTGIYGLMAVQGSFAQLLPEVHTEASGLCWAAHKPSENQYQYTAGAIPVENVFNNLIWGALYQAIANCNIFIKACEDSESGDWSSKPNMIAQAKFMRGVCYYVLYSFYGGVPLRLEPSDKDTQDAPRATRQQVIDQIVKDWTEAAVDLDETSALASSKPTAPNKYSAYAYLTKLYWILGCNSWAAENGDYWASGILKQTWPEMQSGEVYFKKAKEYGDLVLNESNFDLEPDFNTLYNGQRLSFSKEFVFVIDATKNTTENVGYNSLHWTFSPQNCSQGETWGRSQPNKSFYDWAHGTYQDDARLKVTFISKWKKFVNNQASDEWQAAYPYVLKNVNDTTWVDSIVRPGRPPVKVPVITKKQEFKDSIDYINGGFEDPTNPKIEELDSLICDAFCKTKGPNDYNINDWPYFGKYMTNDVSGRYANNNLYVYRFADFLLLMADVENELNNTGTAITLVNRVLQRARNSSKPASTYPKDLSATLSKDGVREYVFHERLFELAAEFDGFTDTRRRGIEWRRKLLERNNNHHITAACFQYGVENKYTAYWKEYWYPDEEGKIDWNSYLVKNQLIPIPQMELTTNGKISIDDQNPGYSQ